MPTTCYTHMSVDERETLILGLAQGHSLREMSTVLGWPSNMVSHEHARNAARGRPYRVCTAHTRRRPRTLVDPWLGRYVRTLLVWGYSPASIAGRLRREGPHDVRTHRSAETIYVGLYVMPRGGLRSALLVTPLEVFTQLHHHSPVALGT